MKLLFTFIISTLTFTLHVNATLPVVDYAGNIQNEINAVAAYIRQGLQYAEEKTIALKEIQQVENQIVELECMGDPRSLMQLPGVSNIQTLGAIIAQFKTDVAQLETLVNPNTALSTAQQVLQTYGQTLQNGFNVGSLKSSPVSLFQFSASNYNTVAAVQQTIQHLQQTKQTLVQQRDSAISAMQSASDQSSVQKYIGIIESLNAAIADINAQITQSVQSGQSQQQKNNAAQQISSAATTQQSVAAFTNDVNNSINQLNTLSQDFGSGPHWPAN